MFDQIRPHGLTPDGLGRAAIVQREDGLYCLVLHWIWPENTRKAFNVADIGWTNWGDDKTPLNELYEGVDPEPGLYGSLDEARRAIANLSGFAEDG